MPISQLDQQLLDAAKQGRKQFDELYGKIQNDFNSTYKNINSYDFTSALQNPNTVVDYGGGYKVKYGGVTAKSTGNQGGAQWDLIDLIAPDGTVTQIRHTDRKSTASQIKNAITQKFGTGLLNTGGFNDRMSYLSSIASQAGDTTFKTKGVKGYWDEQYREWRAKRDAQDYGTFIAPQTGKQVVMHTPEDLKNALVLGFKKVKEGSTMPTPEEVAMIQAAGYKGKELQASLDAYNKANPKVQGVQQTYDPITGKTTYGTTVEMVSAGQATTPDQEAALAAKKTIESGTGSMGRKWGESRPGERYPQVEGPGNPSWEARNPDKNPNKDIGGTRENFLGKTPTTFKTNSGQVITGTQNQYGEFIPDTMPAPGLTSTSPYGTQVGKLQYVKDSSGNYQAVPYAGNTPSGFTEISKDEFIKGVQQQLADVDNPAIRNKITDKAYLQGLITKAQQDTGQVQKGYENKIIDASGNLVDSTVATKTAEMEALVAKGVMKKVPVGNGFGYLPVGSAGDLYQTDPNAYYAKYGKPQTATYQISGQQQPMGDAIYNINGKLMSAAAAQQAGVNVSGMTPVSGGVVDQVSPVQPIQQQPISATGQAQPQQITQQPTQSFNIPFAPNLNDLQKQSINNLVGKGTAFNQTDAANFAYSIGLTDPSRFVGLTGQQALALLPAIQKAPTSITEITADTPRYQLKTITSNIAQTQGTTPATSQFIDATFQALHGRKANAGELSKFANQPSSKVYADILAGVPKVKTGDLNSMVDRISTSDPRLDVASGSGEVISKGGTPGDLLAQYGDKLAQLGFTELDKLLMNFQQGQLADIKGKLPGARQEEDALKGEYEKLKTTNYLESRAKELFQGGTVQDLFDFLAANRKRLENEITSRDLGLSGIGNQPIASEIILGQKRVLQEQATARIGAITASSEAAMGELDRAIQTSDRVMSAIKEDRKNQIDALENLLDMAREDRISLEDDEKEAIKAEIEIIKDANDRLAAEKDDMRKLVVDNPLVAAAAGVSFTDTYEEALNKILTAAQNPSSEVTKLLRLQEGLDKKAGGGGTGVIDPRNTGTLMTKEEFIKAAQDNLGMTLNMNDPAVKTEIDAAYNDYVASEGGSGATVGGGENYLNAKEREFLKDEGFSNSQILELETAGLQRASKKEQLDYLQSQNNGTDIDSLFN